MVLFTQSYNHIYYNILNLFINSGRFVNIHTPNISSPPPRAFFSFDALKFFFLSNSFFFIHLLIHKMCFTFCFIRPTHYQLPTINTYSLLPQIHTSLHKFNHDFQKTSSVKTRPHLRVRATMLSKTMLFHIQHR